MLKKIKSFFTDSIGAKALWLAPVLYIFFAKIAYAEMTPPAAISLYNMALNPFDAILSFFSLILYLISNYVLSPILSFVSGTLFNWALNLVITTDTSEIIKPAWSYTLGFANNFFILILLAIAVGTILGLGDFNYKKILPKFFMVILLINFSLTIGLMIIDTTNALSKFFVDTIQKDGGKSLTEKLITSLNATVILEQTNKTVDAFGGTKTKNTTTNTPKPGSGEEAAARSPEDKARLEAESTASAINAVAGQGSIATNNLGSNDIKVSALSLFFKFIMIIVFQLILIGTLLIGAIYMITRTFWLWLLLMVAPLAWIAHLLPNTEEYWKKWWGLFIQWAFFAPTYLFMVSIAIGITSKTFAKSGTMGNLATYSDFSAAQVIQMLCVAFLMMAGIHLGRETGGTTANGIINYGKGLGSRYGKTLNNLRSKGFIGKTLEKIGPEDAAKFTAKIISRVPGAGAVGFTTKKLEMERLRENSKKIKEESEKYQYSDFTQLEADITDAIQKGGQITIEQAAKISAYQERAKLEKGTLDDNTIRELRKTLSYATTGVTYGGSPGFIPTIKPPDTPQADILAELQKITAKL